VVEALADDLNVQAALVRLNELEGSELASALSFLGFERYRQKAAPAVDESEIRATIDRRLELIRAKNWPEADRIRDALLEKGIQLKDAKDPATGERITQWEVRR